MQENLRRFERKMLTQSMRVMKEMIYDNWRKQVHSKSRKGGKAGGDHQQDVVMASGEAAGSIPISGSLVGKVKYKELLAEMAIVENFYETRIAAAERLIGFFVMFHQAVKPLSRFWFIKFDLDRSESRLRVSSTPAPIPYVEELKVVPRFVQCSMKIQREYRHFVERKAAAAKEGRTKANGGFVKSTGSVKMNKRRAAMAELKAQEEKELGMEQIEIQQVSVPATAAPAPVAPAPVTRRYGL